MKYLPKFGLAFLGPAPTPSTSNSEMVQPYVNSFSPAIIIPGVGKNLFFSLPVLSWGKSSNNTEAFKEEKRDIQIGIIGGGICGNSVAHSLAKKLWIEKKQPLKNNYHIVVLEGDPHSAATTSLSTIGEPLNFPPQWCAATARNANSIVPGSSMHVFSRKSVLWQVLHDTIEEWCMLKKDQLQKILKLGNLAVSRQEDFKEPPPYFDLHLFKCLGPTASSDERWSFIRFCKSFLYSTLVLGDQAASKRGRYMCDLAKANRDIFLQETEDLNNKGYDITYSQGFIALYRSLESAQKSLETTKQHGEEAQLLSYDEAVAMEPHIQNIPIKPLYAVYRPNEIISSCEVFFRALTQEIRNLGVQVHGFSKVENVESFKCSENQGKTYYRVRCEDGKIFEFDVLVLAAGVHTLQVARGLHIGQYLNVYPLRGYSLSIFEGLTKERDQNLVKKPFSIDSLYISATPGMRRFAGFGEFVGYPEKAVSVPSIGPSVLSRYAKSIFPKAKNGDKDDAVWCFRPISPDDLPLVGPIPKHRGLFVHTGHGTLGWTTGLATGQCVAQTIVEFLGEDEDNPDQVFFEFDHGTRMERKLLAPARFAHSDHTT